MESNFRSTVLGWHSSSNGDEGRRRRDRRIDEDDRHQRDILKAGSSNKSAGAPGGAQAPPPPGPPPPRHAFSLRSPTQSDFHRPSAYPTSPPTAASPNSRPSSSFAPPRPSAPVLHNPFAQSPSSTGHSYPPPPLGPDGRPPSSSTKTTISGLQAPSHTSPLHAPAIYYPQHEVHQPGASRELAATAAAPAAAAAAPGSFYDPTTDITTSTKNQDRGRSDAGPRHNATLASPPKPRDPYYSQPSEVGTYHNGNTTYTSPATNKFAPRSPLSHSHPHPSAGSISPSSRPKPMPSPSLRHAASPPTDGDAKRDSTPATSLPYMMEVESPSKGPAASGTPSRTAAGVMSFSNILSSSEPAPEPRPKSPATRERRDQTPKVEKAIKAEKMDKPEKVEKEKPAKGDKVEKAEKKEKAPRKPAKSHTSNAKNSESTPKAANRRSSSKRDSTPSQPRVPAKRQVNGQPKHKGLPADKEKRVREVMEQLAEEPMDIDSEGDGEERAWRERRMKRRLAMEALDDAGLIIRQEEGEEAFSRKLVSHAELGKRRYDDMYYDEALQEVRERELFAEKERKKDMQRKRRREKSMAVTLEQKEAALAKAAVADNEDERQKLLRDAERANKKAQQTKMILQKGIKGPVRSLAPFELNLEGGTMATFQAENMEPGKNKGKGRAGTRPKKSKEQKQAEKDSAEAAQAALDAGLELPAKEDTPIGKIKLKIKNSADKDKENKEPEDTEEVEEEAAPVKKKKGKAPPPTPPPEARFETKGYNQIYDQIWRDVARKDVNKAFKLASDSYATKASNLKKTAILASKEAKRWQLRTNKGTKDLQARAKRVMRDMMGFWKRNEREERDLRKAAEKQELENARKEEADREAARQKRKLNFLISQTELYSHFIGKKIKTQEVERSTDHPDEAPDEKEKDDANHMNVDEPDGDGTVRGKVTNFEDLDFDAEDESQLKAAAMANAQHALAEAQQKARDFNKDDEMDEDGEMNFQNPTGLGDVEIEQPKLLNAQLKEYQLKGLNWLANLYEQGINGILADEMGLGKTVQSISVMAYLAEKYDIWGPFLVVAPASTLHNWQQEITKFVPDFKVLPYWGSAGDRKVLRKFWDRKHATYKKDAPFHVMITSYQLVVSDASYFAKMKWQYMILDEAQAIKSSSSSRWKSLLAFHCRNRLLLTGTPIQNNMQELWALLHFIMPSLFDSHDEFSEWFSKDIESHAQSNTKLNEDQLKRLHMILKPFMLRRVKKHVQKELGDKIELDIFCDLTYRQRAIYQNLRNQISIMDLLEKATTGDDNDTSTLMNLVMQFRKVCNHPDLFERADITSPYSMSNFAETGSFIREGNNIAVAYSARNTVEYELPRLIWTESGRLDKAGGNNQKAGFRNKYLNHMFNIWKPDNIKDSLDGTDSFSWLRFADTSPEEVYQATHRSLVDRAATLVKQSDRLAAMKVVYDELGQENFTPAHALFQIKPRHDRKALAGITKEGILGTLMNVARHSWKESGLHRLEQAGRPRASAPPIEVACSSRGALIERERIMFNGPIRKTLFGPTLLEERALVEQRVPLSRYPTPYMYPPPDNEKNGFTNIKVPSMRRFVTDAGKLAKLDQLLFKLKNEGHRVLLYFQMTRMIDLMEEYLTYRNWKYCRLDGSTKLEDRRDTVHDFQTRPEIFIFLLSTRAGGLGINLVAADTVIFYDSDWNPTIDSQAMDRAHRLGQTRQVTVYRMITKGTIEERIRKRALQKEEVQRVVIQGGGASVDFSGRRAPENRNRDIAMWLADDEQAEMIERREKELLESGELEKTTKKKGSKRKRAAPASGEVSLDDMYHEGEGHFDDMSKQSGTATPANDEPSTPANKRKKSTGKKAKSVRARLAIADGDVNA